MIFIYAWYDKWLDDDLICNTVPFVDIQDTQLTVKDIYYDNAWHWEKLATQIPPLLRMQMQSYFIDGTSDDVLIWSGANSGIYSAKDGYNWIMQQIRQHSTDSISWSWVWKLKVTELITLSLA